MAENNTHFLARIGQQPGENGRALKYDPAHCDTIKLLAQAGKFPETWACEIGVSVETLRLWGHRYPEFKDAMIIAKHLLGHYWTEQVASGVWTEKSAPGEKPKTANAQMFALLVRRLPALFGNEPVDLTEYVLRPDAPEDQAAPEALTAETAKAAQTDDLQARLEALRRRREEDKG